MDDRHPSIPPEASSELSSGAAPIIDHVRSHVRDTHAADAIHCRPSGVEEQRTGPPDGRQVVTYCFHGEQLSEGIAAALRIMGLAPAEGA